MTSFTLTRDDSIQRLLQKKNAAYHALKDGFTIHVKGPGVDRDFWAGTSLEYLLIFNWDEEVGQTLDQFFQWIALLTMTGPVRLSAQHPLRKMKAPRP